jgi:hypothetical protein
VSFGVDLLCGAAVGSGDGFAWIACVCLPVWFRALIWNVSCNQAGKPTHAIQGKPSPEPTAAPHSKATSNDLITHLCS